MNTDQFRRCLAKQGCAFEEGRRHTIIYRGTLTSAMPRHGDSKQLGTGLMRKIKKYLGIE